jgi:hypothetical protein
MCNGSYELVPRTYKSLWGTRQDIFSSGIPTPRALTAPPSRGLTPRDNPGTPQLTCTRHRYDSQRMLKSHPFGKTHPKGSP